MYNYGDKVICMQSDYLAYLIVGDIYKVVGLHTESKRIQLDVNNGLLWVGYEKFVPFNDVTKLLYTTKFSMDWS